MDIQKHLELFKKLERKEGKERGEITHSPFCWLVIVVIFVKMKMEEMLLS